MGRYAVGEQVRGVGYELWYGMHCYIERICGFVVIRRWGLVYWKMSRWKGNATDGVGGVLGAERLRWSMRGIYMLFDRMYV